jgi:hypothetical protein
MIEDRGSNQDIGQDHFSRANQQTRTGLDRKDLRPSGRLQSITRMLEESSSREFGPVIDLSKYMFEPLRRDEDSILYRGRKEGDLSQILVLAPAREEPGRESMRWLEHEYALREELDPAWAVRPIALGFHWNRPVLVLEDPGGVPLSQLLDQVSELGTYLRLAINLAAVIGRLHDRGLVHKDIKPANILANAGTGQVWLIGFGIASSPTYRLELLRAFDTAV